MGDGGATQDGVGGLAGGGVSSGLLTNLERTVALSYSAEAEAERECGICAHQIMSS